MKRTINFLPQSIIMMEHENVKQNRTPLLDAMIAYKKKTAHPSMCPDINMAEVLKSWQKYLEKKHYHWTSIP